MSLRHGRLTWFDILGSVTSCVIVDIVGTFLRAVRGRIFMIKTGLSSTFPT